MTFDQYYGCGSCNSQCTAMEREVSLALILFCYFKDLCFMCVNAMSAYMSVHCVCLVPAKVRGVCRIPWIRVKSIVSFRGDARNQT